jgi:hypothetical protein
MTLTEYLLQNRKMEPNYERAVELDAEIGSIVSQIRELEALLAKKVKKSKYMLKQYKLKVGYKCGCYNAIIPPWIDNRLNTDIACLNHYPKQSKFYGRYDFNEMEVL